VQRPSASPTVSPSAAPSRTPSPHPSRPPTPAPTLTMLELGAICSRFDNCDKCMRYPGNSVTKVWNAQREEGKRTYTQKVVRCGWCRFSNTCMEGAKSGPMRDLCKAGWTTSSVDRLGEIVYSNWPQTCAPTQAPTPPPTTHCVCEDSCTYFTKDGTCDDGGPGSRSKICALGTDCTDCGSSLRKSLAAGEHCLYTPAPTPTLKDLLALSANKTRALWKKEESKRPMPMRIRKHHAHHSTRVSCAVARQSCRRERKGAACALCMAQAMGRRERTGHHTPTARQTATSAKAKAGSRLCNATAFCFPQGCLRGFSC
jgi:hypothetical protein